ISMCTVNITSTSKRHMPARAYAHSSRQDGGTSVQNFSDAPGKPACPMCHSQVLRSHQQIKHKGGTRCTRKTIVKDSGRYHEMRWNVERICPLALRYASASSNALAS